MKSDYRYVKDFKVEGKPFRFIIDWSGQLILLNMTYISDGWGDVLPCESYRSVGARLGAKVYFERLWTAPETSETVLFGFYIQRQIW